MTWTVVDGGDGDRVRVQEFTGPDRSFNSSHCVLLGSLNVTPSIHKIAL